VGQRLVAVEQSRLAPTAAEIALGVVGVVAVLGLVVLCGLLVVRVRRRRKR
jgi:flagellar biogenesis protein FliO